MAAAMWRDGDGCPWEVGCEAPPRRQHTRRSPLGLKGDGSRGGLLPSVETWPWQSAWHPLLTPGGIPRSMLMMRVRSSCDEACLSARVTSMGYATTSPPQRQRTHRMPRSATPAMKARNTTRSLMRGIWSRSLVKRSVKARRVFPQNWRIPNRSCSEATRTGARGERQRGRGNRALRRGCHTASMTTASSSAAPWR